MDEKDQRRIFKRGAADVIGEEDLISRLKEDRPLNIKFGVDPTAPDIHLGHTVSLQKLRQLQGVGHNVQLVIGDFTAMIGDPSGRSATRPMLTKKEIAANLLTYTAQIFKLLDVSRTSIYYNSDWLSTFSSKDLFELTSKATLNQLLGRRDFNQRMVANKPLSLTELLYPLLVGYDSVHLHSDVEIGGTDQLFNFMASRDMQQAYGQTPEAVITLPLLVGIDGVKKMSKSLRNAIGVTEAPAEMYHKLVNLPPTLVPTYFELLSDVPLEELDHIRTEILATSDVQKQYRHQLAFEIVERYHGTRAASTVAEAIKTDKP